MTGSFHAFIQCPLSTPLGVMGKRWTLQILRDIEFFNITRFTDLSVSIRGITRRMLSTRLDQLTKEELIEKSNETHCWQLTPKGKDMMRVVNELTLFRLKWEQDRIFGDKHPKPSQLA